jgi:hypothetical protein
MSSKTKVAHLPISLRMEETSSPAIQKAVAGRVDLRHDPAKGRLRCGVDPLAALRIARPDPRTNMKGRKATPKEADKAAKELWLSHPVQPGAWLHVWVSPAVWEIARQLEIFWKLEPRHRDEQALVGVLQRVSDLRMLSVVIVSERTENHRRPNGAEVAGYELLSGISTTAPQNAEAVLSFSAELSRLFATDEAQKIVLGEIEKQNAERLSRASHRLAKAAASMIPATANDNKKGAA